MEFSCFVPMCAATFGSAKSLVAHIKVLHSSVNIQKFSCTYPNCCRDFDRMKFFEKHVQSHKNIPPELSHIKRRKTSSKIERRNIFGDSSADLNDNAAKDGDECASDVDGGMPSDTQMNKSVLFFTAVSKSVTEFLSRLYSRDTLTRSQIQELVEDLKQLFCGSFFDILQDSVMETLQDSSSENASEIRSLFDILKGMFDDVDTEWKRTKFFAEKKAYIEPEKYVVGTANMQKSVHGQIVPEPVLLTGTFLSTRKILQSFLELPGVLDKILSYMTELESESDVMVNVVQGSLWKEVIKPKFGDKTVLPLTVSVDDLETNKDLGSHATVHKLCATHVGISCLPPQFASQLENMFLTLLFHTSDKAFGLDEVFRPFLMELEYLETEGIGVNVNGVVKRVYFALCLLIGDNLGLAFILGMNENFIANFFCRICKVHRDQAKELTYEPVHLLRTRANYEEDLRANDPSSTGIKVMCIWNRLVSFFITENIYADIMHDLPEGVGNYVMCFVIEYIVVTRKWIGWSELNDLVQGFFFGSQEFGNKPPLISADRVKNEKLGFSASEQLCLMRYFPLMVGHKVAEDDPVWRLYLSLREIVDLVFAPMFSRSHIPYLTELIADHHKAYLQLSGRKLRPKFHLMLHYGRIIERVGPLKPISAMRSESKYKELRQAAHVTSSRKHISLTLAKKASLKVCSRLISQRGLQDRFVVSPYCERVLLSSLDGCDNLVVPTGVTDDGFCHVANWVKVNGTDYRAGMIVVLNLGDPFPLFGEIHLVVALKGGEAGFVVKPIVTCSFSRHLYSYEVQDAPVDSYVFVKQRDLISYVPAHKRLFFDGKTYVMPRHAL